MKICMICDKQTLKGNNVSHSNRKTKRAWKPNLQKTTLIMEGFKIKLRACTKCIKRAVKIG